MIIAKTLQEFKSAYNALEHKNDIGFIPTMGALHHGHLSLIKESVDKCKHSIVSIFINPTQFNNPSDFSSYPRTIEKDCTLIEPLGVDIVFAPRVIDIYPDAEAGNKTLDTRIFDLGGLDQYGEGANRPGHFNGVAQVVTHLFNIVKPTKAFFGEKDFQQLAIIKYFTKDLNFPIEVIGCPIARANNGLALSSRNALLTPEQREAAPHIFRSISSARELSGNNSITETIDRIIKTINRNIFLETEYVEIINALTLQPITSWDQAESIQLTCAVYAYPIRLIDNIKIK